MHNVGKKRKEKKRKEKKRKEKKRKVKKKKKKKRLVIYRTGEWITVDTLSYELGEFID